MDKRDQKTEYSKVREVAKRQYRASESSIGNMLRVWSGYGRICLITA